MAIGHQVPGVRMPPSLAQLAVLVDVALWPDLLAWYKAAGNGATLRLKLTRRDGEIVAAVRPRPRARVYRRRRRKSALDGEAVKA